MGYKFRTIAVVFACWLAAAGFTGKAVAQIKQPPQAKPWLLAIVDTSSTMGPVAVPPSLTVPNLGSNSCGFTQNSTTRITHAKCALNRAVTATGDAVFGLMQFAQTGCNTGGACNENAESGKMLVNIKEGNQQEILKYVDDVGACLSENELTAGNLTNVTYTPLPGALALARDYFCAGSPGTPDNTPACGTAPSPFSISPTKTDIYAACRPMAVILLTDGIEQCEYVLFGDPPQVGRGAAARARELRSTMIAVPTSVDSTGYIKKDIRTYVIGFGIAEGNASIEAIATEGGTDAPGQYKGFYPTNEAGLSLAFTQIIDDAQLNPEVCNNKDDNCNGLIDEGIVKFCNKPQGIMEPTLCEKPDETVCDTQDDNCDGQTDEGLVINACGFCGDPPAEVCDTIDNDCDTQTDEGLDDMTTCGSSVGNCREGRLRCIAGQYVCVGDIKPTKEICNCQDDDCDGQTDEDTAGDLCEPGSVCYQCECLSLCKPGIEFKGCDSGKRELEDETGRCICVRDTCDPNTCAAKTQRNGDGEIICAPINNLVGPCRCFKGECVSSCEGIVCQAGQSCNPKDGRCITDRCEYRNCDTGKRCDPLSGECVEDLCAKTACADGQMCRDGECVTSCGDKECKKGSVCKGGKCQVDPCAGITCRGAQICVSEKGKCMDDLCAHVSCGFNQTCDPLSGDCVADPCTVVTCPQGQRCVDGECYSKAILGADAGASSDTKEKSVTPGGGGGCSCAVTGKDTQRTGGLLWLAGLGLLWVRARRRIIKGRVSFFSGVSRSSGVFFLTCLVALVISGCRVDPVNLESGDAAHFNKKDAASSDSGKKPDREEDEKEAGVIVEGDATTQADTSVGADAEKKDACVESRPEVCNLRDDDCDGETDEGLTPPQGYCGTTGMCATVVAKCGSTGAWVCEFPTTYQDTETACDGLDNDCDGNIDEVYPSLGQPCSAGKGTCHREGTIVCKKAGDGTECSISQGGDPGEEVCDGIDNDCDGLIDETKSDPGTNPSYVKESLVNVAGKFLIQPYEVSRPDATDTSQGVSSVRPCSRAGVLPWTNITYPDAKVVCESIGLRLCTENDWQQACQGGGTTKCSWSYTPASGGTCNDFESHATACNGKEYGNAASEPGEWLLPAGGLAECYANFGAAGKVYDMSGNVKEWTSSASSPGANPIRGGSMNNIASGLKCDFSFTVANDTFSYQNVGFRCCANASYQP
jgi:MYXO-CTERM domain-containing protein